MEQKRPLENPTEPPSKSAKTNDSRSPQNAVELRRQWRKDDNKKWIVPKVTKAASAEAKRYLKKNGLDDFLITHLPDLPVSLDILNLTVLLGFCPKGLEDDLESDTHMSKYIKLLQKALNKAMYSRSRIPEMGKLDVAFKAIEKAKNIIVLTGAGISTSLGIPDFRSSIGIYSLIQGYTHDPQEVFDLATFRNDPELFYKVAYMILPPENKWTPTHQFIKTLSEKGKLLRNYTQNIDNLEGIAGLPENEFIQCHGSFAYATCRTCQKMIEGHKIFPMIRLKQLPICPNCESKRNAKMRESDKEVGDFGVMKPNIVFFGEDLPKEFYKSQDEDVAKCDLVICIGTSLKVAPVNNIVNMVPPDVPQILINKDDISHSEFDLTLLGYCDEVVTYLTDKLGWSLNHEQVPSIRDLDLKLQERDPEVGLYEIVAQKERPPKVKEVEKINIE